MKRIVITAGDARVGKSTTSKLLLDLYLEDGINPHVTYSGHRNKLDPYKEYTTIYKFNLERGDYDEFLGSLQREKDIDVVLMDMPGQILPEFIKFAREICLFEALHSIGYRITFLHPISTRIDCIEYLNELTAEFGSKADYVIVKNQCFTTGQFLYYDGKPIEVNIEKLKGVTMQLPALSNHVYSKVEEAQFTYGDAAGKLPRLEVRQKMPVLERSLIFSWMNKFRLALYSDPELLKYFGLTV